MPQRRTNKIDTANALVLCYDSTFLSVVWGGGTQEHSGVAELSRHKLVWGG